HESQKDQPNWLLVYDLLTDVAACLEQIENPSAGRRYQPARYWWGYTDSQAAAAVALMDAASMSRSSDGGGVSGSSGGDPGGSGGDSGGGGGGDFGGFGGGDSGGGGASSDY